MRLLATHRHRAFWLMLLVLIPLALVHGRANAQVDPLWDHYKVYFTNPPIPYPVPGPLVTLTDQFTTSTHTVEVMELFANPVEKTHGPQVFPINDPVLHYSWWKISPHPFSAVVTAVNQFGDHTINVFDAQYLLNPALKNQTGQPPVENHYKCYHCQGPPINAPIGMVDQFGPWTATVTFPRFFCNPTDKQVQGLPPNLMVDPNQHYICYEFQPEDPNPHAVVVTDQFVANRTTDLHPSRLICVPTYKSGVTDAARDTWGKLKQLYR